MDDKFRNITNRLSLAFYCDDEVLFMWDLEKEEINRVVRKLKNINKTEFYVLITPHHGTHWDDKLSEIRCEYAVASNNKHKF